MIGNTLGPDRVEAKLGEGGMGEECRARDTRLNRDVAIKVLTGGLAGDARFRERFEHEARSVAALNHPTRLEALRARKVQRLVRILSDSGPGRKEFEPSPSA